MRRIKLLGLALMAVFAFGVVAAASASAEEKEPAGLLYLTGETAPVKITSAKIADKISLTTAGLKNVAITCTAFASEGEAGKEESSSHTTLGSLNITYTGCKLNALACSSENIKGEKAAKEEIKQVAPDTDIHFVSLENSAGKLIAGILVGLLELVEGTTKKDLTLVCGIGKNLVLGAVFLEANKASPTEEVKLLQITPAPPELKCDKNDTLCKKLLASWGATATLKGKEKDEKVLCPLGAFIEVEEECATLSIEKLVPTELSKKVFLDF